MFPVEKKGFSHYRAAKDTGIRYLLRDSNEKFFRSFARTDCGNRTRRVRVKKKRKQNWSMKRARNTSTLAKSRACVARRVLVFQGRKHPQPQLPALSEITFSLCLISNYTKKGKNNEAK